MLNISGTENVLLACGSTDMRRSIDGLATIVQQCFSLDPFSTNLYVFCNKNRTMKQIKVADLCSELEQKLVEFHNSDDSMRRYRKVFREFTEYADGCDYSQPKGTDFLVWKFQQIGGFVTGGEHSKNGMYYFRAIRSLAEYYNFGILFCRNEFHGEIAWPEPFKEATEGFLRYEVEYGCSHWQYERCKAVSKDQVRDYRSLWVHRRLQTRETISCYYQDVQRIQVPVPPHPNHRLPECRGVIIEGIRCQLEDRHSCNLQF